MLLGQSCCAWCVAVQVVRFRSCMLDSFVRPRTISRSFQTSPRSASRCVSCSRRMRSGTGPVNTVSSWSRPKLSAHLVLAHFDVKMARDRDLWRFVSRCRCLPVSTSDVVLETSVSPRGSLELDFWNVSPRLGLEVGKSRVNFTLRLDPGPLFNIDRCYAYGIIKT